MEFDELMRGEGLDAAGVEDALAWARQRAEELVRGVQDDPELGPLLDGATPVPSASPATVAAPEARAPVPSPPPRQEQLVSSTEAALRSVPDPYDEETFSGQAPSAESPRRLSVRERAAALGDSVRRAAAQPASVVTPAEPDVDVVVPDERDEAVSAADPAPADPAPPEPVAGEAEAAPDEAVSEGAVSEGAASFESAPEEASRPEDFAVEEARPPEDATAEEAQPPQEVQPTEDVAASEEAVPEPDATASEAVAHAEEEPAATPTEPEPGADAVAAEAAAVEAEAAAPPEPEPELDPLAGIDFDDLPGFEEEDEPESPLAAGLTETPLGASPRSALESQATVVPTDGAGTSPDMTNPAMDALDVTQAMQAPEYAAEVTERAPNPLLAKSTDDEDGDDDLGMDLTQRASNPFDPNAPDASTSEGLEVGEPPEGGEAPAASAAGSAEAPAAAGGTVEMPAVSEDDDEAVEEIEEFELLDDDDFELVEEDEGAAAGATDEQPEWKAALVSAQLGGGDRADQDSGLLQVPGKPPVAEPPADDEQ